MKTLSLLALLLISLTTLSASPLLTLTPGTATAVPGQTTGWDFTLTSDDTYNVVVVAAFINIESNPNLGYFADWISLAGGPVNNVLAPNAPDWFQPYSPVNMTGFGEYNVDINATPGDLDIGEFLVVYQRFSGDPNTCSQCYVDTQTLSADFAVAAVNPSEPTPTPEPATSSLLGCALLAAMLIRYRRTVIAMTRMTKSKARSSYEIG